MAALVLGVLGLLPSQQADAQAAPELNDPAYWETQTEHESQCFKHEGGDLLSNVHGTSDGLVVFLNSFNPSWFGDHWELLVVKAATENAVYDHPIVGVPYPAATGQEVSHWIICKGLGGTTTTETTTSSTQPTSTTTTTQPTTTTETTTPTSTTSTTIPYDSTTTSTGVTTAVTPSTSPSSSVQPTTNTLPFTGLPEDVAGIAVGLILMGGLVLLTMQSSRRFSKE